MSGANETRGAVKVRTRGAVLIEDCEDSKGEDMDGMIDHGSIMVSLDRSELLAAIERDCVTFLSFYLGDQLTLDVPEFHIEIWDEFLDLLQKARNPRFIVGQLKKLFCVPRGHAKSTLSKLAVILFMRYSPFSFTVYASNTRPIAIAAIKDIKSWLESPQEVALYGAPLVEKANESDALWIMHIFVPGFSQRKRIILKALGADSQVRGTLVDSRRPELVVVDDCEDLSTASSETTQARLDEWLLGSLLKAVAKKSIVIMLGNMIRKTTLIARLSVNKGWNPTVFGAIVRDRATKQLKPLWDGLYTLESLIEEYMEYRRLGRGHVWIHEMMNLTAEEVFGTDMQKAILIPRPNPDQIASGCIVLDPAFGQNNWNDESALTVHVQLRDKDAYGYGMPHVVESRVRRMTEEEILTELIELSLYWGISTWCIEAVAAQRLFIPFFRLAMRIRELNPDQIAIVPITGGKESKPSRIKAFRNSVAAGAYGIADGMDTMFQKLLEYDPTSTEHDDELDSGALGMVAWDLYGKMIEANGITNVAMALMAQPTEGAGLSQLEVSPM